VKAKGEERGGLTPGGNLRNLEGKKNGTKQGAEIVNPKERDHQRTIGLFAEEKSA